MGVKARRQDMLGKDKVLGDFPDIYGKGKGEQGRQLKREQEVKHLGRWHVLLGPQAASG